MKEKLACAPSGCPITCETCRSMATHEDCEKDGGCLHIKTDYEQYRTVGIMPPMRYRHWIESSPQEQMGRYHDMQVKGERSITLGPGEADVFTTSTPEETSRQLHHVAEHCGYGIGNLTKHDDGRQTLKVWKDYGPFEIEWKDSVLMRIYQGEEKARVTFWDRSAQW